jgi:DNA-binding MarR family transcriptional regulator
MAKRSRRVVTDELLAAGRASSNAAVMFHSVVAEKQGLSAVEEKSIDLLQRFGPLTAGELSQHSGLAAPSVTGLIDRLEQKGFVRRIPDPKDGRKVRVQFAQERLAEFVPLFTDLVQELEALCATYSVEELEVIQRFMNEAARRQQACAAKLSGAASKPESTKRRPRRP